MKLQQQIKLYCNINRDQICKISIVHHIIVKSRQFNLYFEGKGIWKYAKVVLQNWVVNTWVAVIMSQFLVCGKKIGRKISKEAFLTKFQYFNSAITKIDSQTRWWSTINISKAIDLFTKNLKNFFLLKNYIA